MYRIARVYRKSDINDGISMKFDRSFQNMCPIYSESDISQFYCISNLPLSCLISCMTMKNFAKEICDSTTSEYIQPIKQDVYHVYNVHYMHHVHHVYLCTMCTMCTCAPCATCSRYAPCNYVHHTKNKPLRSTSAKRR